MTVKALYEKWGHLLPWGRRKREHDEFTKAYVEQFKQGFREMREHRLAATRVLCNICGDPMCTTDPSPGGSVSPYCIPQGREGWINWSMRQFEHTEEKVIPMSDMNRPQQDPKPGKTPVTGLVISDLRIRQLLGVEKYGTELKTQNGRDALIDAYQEALDLVMYLRQTIEEKREAEGRADTKLVEFWPTTTSVDVDEVLKERSPADHILDAVDVKIEPIVSLSSPGESFENLFARPGRAIPVDSGDRMTAREFLSYREAEGTRTMTTLTADESIAQEAHRLVLGDRGAAYGHPIDDFGRTAGMLNALLGAKLSSPLTEEDVACALICVKLSRERNHPKRDNVVDIAGYAITLEMVKEERARRAKAADGRD